MIDGENISSEDYFGEWQQTPLLKVVMPLVYVAAGCWMCCFLMLLFCSK